MQQLKVVDNTGREWILEQCLGSGGFGKIYNCKRHVRTSSRLNDALYKRAIKLEPAHFGCLENEIKIYKQLNRPSARLEFLKQRRIDCIGVPKMISYGTATLPRCIKRKRRPSGKTIPYKFIVLEKMNMSLSKYLRLSGRLKPARVMRIALHISIALEYLHRNGYVHRDLKPGNIMMNHLDEPILIDYGLAEKYVKPVCYNAGDENSYTGTLQYAAIDSHRDNVTYRSDYETLLYNMFTWSGAELPWHNVYDPRQVLAMKEAYKTNGYAPLLNTLPWYCGHRKVKMDQLVRYINSLRFDQTIDYGYVHDILMEMIDNEDA